MSESDSGAEFRRHQGEEHVSKSEAALAGTSFRQMTKELYVNTPEARKVIEGNLQVNSLDLKAEVVGLKAHLHQQIDMKTGKVTIESVGLYKLGETDEEWGAIVCEYISGDRGPEVFRYDEPKSDPGEPLDAETLIEGRNLEIAFGVNGGAVGVEEVSALRDILKQLKQ